MLNSHVPVTVGTSMDGMAVPLAAGGMVMGVVGVPVMLEAGGMVISVVGKLVAGGIVTAVVGRLATGGIVISVVGTDVTPATGELVPGRLGLVAQGKE
jgi:hypothetical protein